MRTILDNRKLLGVAGLLGLLGWTYGNTLAVLSGRWWSDTQYSQGYLIPLVSALLLYLRRDTLRQMAGSPDPRGLLLLLGGLAIHVLSGRLYVDFIDAISLLPALAGLLWAVGGWPLLRAAWPAILFLGFMIPLPFSVEVNISLPLQRLATLGSTFLLQTLSFPAIAEGNIILMSTTRVGVIDACNGLSMLLVVLALATAFCLIARPPWPDRVALIGGALPVAVFVNILRVTATGIAQESWGAEAGRITHDWAGWLMMPAACGLIALELWLLRALFPFREKRPLIGEKGDVSLIPVKPARDAQAARREAAQVWVITVLVLVIAGVWNGLLSDRWGDSTDLTAAVKRLEQVRPALGEWVGRPAPIDTRALQLTEVSSYLSRSYLHRGTGEVVNILILCGRPGPVSVHTPDVCYLGAGYKMGPRAVETWTDVVPGIQAEFWSARFSKPRDPIPLHISWAWSDGGEWHAPQFPRLAFINSRVLYKLYVIRPIRSGTATTDEGLRAFLKELLPELQRSILAGNES